MDTAAQGAEAALDAATQKIAEQQQKQVGAVLTVGGKGNNSTSDDSEVSKRQ